jgi:hypothetical protein
LPARHEDWLKKKQIFILLPVFASYRQDFSPERFYSRPTFTRGRRARTWLQANFIGAAGRPDANKSSRFGNPDYA